MTAGRVAGRFTDLQGLRQALAGVALLLMFGWEMLFPMTLDDIRKTGIVFVAWGLVGLLVAFAVIGVGVVRLNAWYKRRFGEVERTKRQRRLGALIGGSGALAFLIPFNIELDVFTTGHFTGHSAIPINLFVCGLAIWIFGYWLYMGRPFVHYPILAAIGLALAALSLAGIPPAGFVSHLREGTLYFALCTIAGGVIDHAILVRSLAPSPRSLEHDS